MPPVEASLFMMVTCVPLMFIVIMIFVGFTKLLTKLFPAK